VEILTFTHQQKVIEKDNEKCVLEAEGQGRFLGSINEIEFWRLKSANLSNLSNQLHTEKVTHILNILENSSNTYVIGFRKTLNELQNGMLL
jgi:hypothetical protein